MRRDYIRLHADVAEMNPRVDSSLEQIFFSHKGLPCDKWFHYLSVYEQHLGRFKQKPVRLLEIGVQHGGSFQMWRSYLGAAAILHGIDIESKPHAISGLQAVGAVFHEGDQCDEDLLKRIVGEMGGVDVVIDDGGHHSSQQITTFESLYPLLDKNGVYLCEDTHTSYWSEYGGGLQHPNSFVEYAKRRVDDLYSWYADGIDSDVFALSTKSVLFYDSMVVFEREDRSEPKRYVVGSPL